MNQRIIYPNDDGGVSILVPTPEYLAEHTNEEQEAKDAAEMISKMKKTGIHDAIIDKYKSINYFFKPFKKTFKNS